MWLETSPSLTLRVTYCVPKTSELKSNFVKTGLSDTPMIRILKDSGVQSMTGDWNFHLVHRYFEFSCLKVLASISPFLVAGPSMLNSEIARMFDDLSDRLEISGANPFRVRAYRQAAKTLGEWPESLADIAETARAKLTDIPGIGKDLADKIVVIVETSSLPQLEEIRKEVPNGVVEMLRIPGLGPKKVANLFKDLGVSSLTELKQSVESGEVAKLKGFGEKTAKSILEGLANLEQSGSRIYMAEAKMEADAIIEALQKVPGIGQVSAAGSLRRRKETVGDLDLLATASNATAAMDTLAQHPLVAKVLARGDTKQRVRLKSGLELDLRVVPEGSYGAAMQYFTGSKEHNIVVRRRAQERGLKINEYGVFRDDVAIAGKTEEEVYATIGLPWIPPELRENRGEIERAEQGKLPQLVELQDMLGDLHMHTTATDGTATIREMVEAAKSRGLRYIAITDHSKRVAMANGLDADRLRQHWNEIENVRKEISGIEVLKGIECDILEDGTMDLDDEVLAEADWVIAVLHYGLRQPKEQIDLRLMNAIRNPNVSIIGHPTARIIGKRPPVAFSFETFLKAAADYGVMLEINASYMRLDLDDIQAAAARDRGIPIVISTDAHSTQGLDGMQYGVFQARRAGLTKHDVANTLPWPEFEKRIRRGR
jgi:DNA polymerase (family 10)